MQIRYPGLCNGLPASHISLDQWFWMCHWCATAGSKMLAPCAFSLVKINWWCTLTFQHLQFTVRWKILTIATLGIWWNSTHTLLYHRNNTINIWTKPYELRHCIPSYLLNLLNPLYTVGFSLIFKFQKKPLPIFSISNFQFLGTWVFMNIAAGFFNAMLPKHLWH